jgi:superfamily II DNA or RNA helicase
MVATLTNAQVKFDKSELTSEELTDIRRRCSYVDGAVSFQLSKLKRYLHSDHPKVRALRDNLTVRLYEEDDVSLVVPQGLALSELLSVVRRVGLKDDRTLPQRGKEYLWKKTPYDLRYYQRECVDSLKWKSRGQAVMATGSGKSLTFLYLVKEMGLKSLIICPSSLIANQLYTMFARHLGKRVVSMYGDGSHDVSEVTIALYQSVARNPSLFKDENFQLVLVDECQTLGAASLIEITRTLADTAYFYSLSATNFRADGKTPEIYAASGPVRYSFDTVRAIEEGYLAKPIFLVAKVTSEWKEEEGSKKRRQRSPEMKQANYASHVVENDTLQAMVVADARKALARGMSTLILVQEIEHGNRLQAELGLPFANGENSDSASLIDDLNAIRIPGLIAGAQMAGVGVDTVRVDCLIMCSFPGTEALTMQLLGRGLRKYEGKTKVLVLDYIPMGSDMLTRHAFQRIEWYKRFGPVKIIDRRSDTDAIAHPADDQPDTPRRKFLAELE